MAYLWAADLTALWLSLNPLFYRCLTSYVVFHLKSNSCCENSLFNSKIIDLWRLPEQEYQREQLSDMKNNIVLNLLQMLLALFLLEMHPKVERLDRYHCFFNIISDGSTELTCLLLAMQKERGSNKSKVMCCYSGFFCQLLSQVHLFSFPCCVSGFILVIWKQITYGYHCYCFRGFLLCQEFWLTPSDSDLQTLDYLWEGCRR